MTDQRPSAADTNKSTNRIFLSIVPVRRTSSFLNSSGVKMIGATAPYVTTDLDEGPIIAQEVEYVTYADTSNTWCAKGPGHRVQSARPCRRPASLDDRVMLNGAKTVVFA